MAVASVAKTTCSQIANPLVVCVLSDLRSDGRNPTRIGHRNDHHMQRGHVGALFKGSCIVQDLVRSNRAQHGLELLSLG